MTAEDQQPGVPPKDTPTQRGAGDPHAGEERAIGAQAEAAFGSNPNGNGPEGLEGGMGVSSERTGPEGSDPRNANPIENTGTKGTAVDSTDGGLDTSPAPRTAEDVQGTEGLE